jgi:RHS repeat-associated protein
MTLTGISNTLNQYTQINRDSQISSQTYDSDGNLLNDGKRVHTWNAENQLVTIAPQTPVTGDKKLTFVYDYMGRRVKKSVYDYNAGWILEKEIFFVYDGWNLIDEIISEGTSASSRYYVWGQDLSGTLQEAGGISGLLARVDESDGSQYGYFYDANGNIGQMIDTDDGSVKASYEYCPFGNVIKNSGILANDNAFRFSTKCQDDETGLIYYGYRYYSPVLGRWIGRDPIEEPGSMLLR